MPYLFVAEKVGWRNKFIEPMEDTPSRDFPESPLSHKNLHLQEPVPHEVEERLPACTRDASPTPMDIAISQLTSRQVYVVSTYRFNEESGTHQQCSRFYIRPRSDIADEFHVSPEFVRREWSIYSGKPLPSWMKYVNYGPDIESHAIHALETEIRKCDRYSSNPENQDVARELNAWAFAMITPGPDIEMPFVDEPMLPPSPEPEQPLPPPPPEVSAAGRPVRAKRKTWKLLQQLPEPAPPVVPDPSPEQTPEPEPQSTAVNWIWKAIRTTVNSFGLYREYPAVPTYNPDETLTMEQMSDIPGGTRSNTATIPSLLTPFEPSVPEEPPAQPGAPSAPSASASTGLFANWSTERLVTWQWTGSATKSIEEMEKLVDVLQDPRFSKEDIMDFDIKRETAKLDQHLASSSTSKIRDGWKSTSVNISVPDGKRHASEADAPVFAVPGLYYRPLVEVIKGAIRDVGDRCFHYTPFKKFWKPTPDSPPQRIHDEIYSSNAMVEAHTALQNQPPEPGCTLERVVLALMFWSDSTHLASFGDASLWPLYLFFGNQSKWLRVKPRSNVCHHVAYFPKLPDIFHDFFKALTGDAPSADVLTHCRRELMHAIWRLLLDDEFLDAYEHGIVIECQDDYPEKVLLATIRNLGKAPCPRCYILKEDIPDLGTVRDVKKRETLARTDEHVRDGTITRIRNWIFKFGRNVKSTTFDYFLLARSWTPTSNAFSDRLSKFGFDPFKMLVPDFMHEFELGVFKSFFIHLLRILYAHMATHGGGAISSLNRRFRLIPTFGRSTIRRFTSNTSALKKLAAWNYENILLCAIPVVEGLLLDPWNSDILDLLFTLAEWHSLAKLKLHTDTTVKLLASVTKTLGRLLRRFKRVVCPEFATKELPSEEAARGRRQAKKAAQGKSRAGAATKTTAKVKEYNLTTYKLHGLGDYAPVIPWVGTTESFSTQPGELEHRRVKRFYARTNKNRAVRQITQLERRDTALMRIASRAHHNARRRVSPTTATPVPQGHRRKPKKTPETHLSFAESEALPYTAPDQHHHIGDTDFLPKLQEHLLSRLSHPEWTGDGNEFTPGQRFRLVLRNDRMYKHKLLRVNYTTYDVRRGQDCLNPRTHSDVMYLAPEGDTTHPFSYAQIIGIYHADVLNTADAANAQLQSMQFLWVRRYRLDRTFRGGFQRKRLHRLEFLPESDPNAFGFLNPDEVIRGAHIIPAFAHGCTAELLTGESIGRLDRDGLEENEDWRYYYVNFFVDRDMYMRYLGGGVGHYQIDIPLEAPTEPEPEPVEDLDDPQAAVPQPPAVPTPPRTPEPGALLPDELERPGSSQSQNSDSTDESFTPADSDSDDSELGGDDDDSADEPDLGPEDGEGPVDEEVEGRLRSALTNHH
ncbi:hypothetical protein MVEN_00725000 [Mycena venus]|uniref:Uncharacterized protein n=1 Tax=Mycena venus TaxID=2733690 RepID=A0A8H7D5T3_9AGAR|nr:hypothetical protein MVEN_00725000 [Mycena venus]